jgi:hypothetical protein
LERQIAAADERIAHVERISNRRVTSGQSKERVSRIRAAQKNTVLREKS